MEISRSTNKLRTAATTGASTARVLFGPEAGLEIAVPAAGLVIGADTTADVRLTDPAVSRRHASVRPTTLGFEVADLSSKNGTFVDNVSITRATLPLGAVLRVGSTLIQLVPAEETILIPPSQRVEFGQMIGASNAMRQIYALLERASASNAPILLIGESGTGKELAARAVHEHSKRADGPFVTFDCGAASDNLIESDLFGHVRGAYTGAQGDRTGAFEMANGGTLFLDEIGDLPLPLQPKLLRMLETGETTPLGSRKSVKSDVRVVAATHHDLAQAVAKGAFRGDLYYRLAVVEVHLPPLRQRIDDIEDLVQGFLARENKREPSIKGPNLERLMGYSWPGNVRELRNVIARAMALAAPGARFAEMPILLTGARTPDENAGARADKPYHEAKNDALIRFERDYLKDLLSRAGSNISQAARLAGVGRKHLYRMMERTELSAGIKPPPDDDDD
jgi:DNA-binding NtrC family response regulator